MHLLANTPNTASVTPQAVTPNNVSVTLQVNTPNNMSVTPPQANTPDNVSVTATQVINAPNNASATPQNKRNNVTRAAFELQLEILWYTEVEKIVRPSYIRNMRNKDKMTPNDLFDSTHAKLMEAGQKWMNATAKSCMLVATLIATVVFAAAFSVPGDNDDQSVRSNS